MEHTTDDPMMLVGRYEGENRNMLGATEPSPLATPVAAPVASVFASNGNV